ncbi:MAG: biopolymer transporter ExbD [Alphaproteobacteria bacterium]|nr:biopolymer transporter ExbD [Alphaproteobacteria bacterium]MBV9693311.1 biopolymer transporter ExbD [Alphaproteobacteria bacterium]
MAATVQSKNNDIVADINTTPLIDVMLVLLTLLIITLPLQTNAIKITTASNSASVPPPIVRVTVDFDGSTSWNGQPVDPQTLDSYLADAARQTPQPAIVIRADRLARYDAVSRVLAQAARAGDTNIGFEHSDE